MAPVSPLDRYHQLELTLQELVETAAGLLKRLEVRPDDRRITPAPDVRSVRYYQTIGVVDRPVRYERRRAVYGFRHLVQLLAVKRFQQEGHPLHLIQRSLAGCPTAVLEEALGSVLSGLGQSPKIEGTASRLRGRSETVARASGPFDEQPTSALSGLAAEPVAPASVPPPAIPTALVAARVAPGITLTMDPALVSSPDSVLSRVVAALAITASGPAAAARDDGLPHAKGTATAVSSDM